MTTFASPNRAFWDTQSIVKPFPPLRTATRVDTAIIGAGIVGLTLADLLKQAGKKVAIIEMARIGTQVTGRSTAKLTVLHKLIYADLIRRHGLETARAYAQMNVQALEHIRERIGHFNIDCALETLPAFTFSETGSGLDDIRAEVDAAQQVGLPATFVKEAPLPFAIAGAIRLDEQYQFHPQRYLQALAQSIPGDDSHVFEQTRALALEEGSPNRVVTDCGVVTARHVVIATAMPFPLHSLLFAKASPVAHVVLAMRIAPESAPGGMFIRTDTPSVSFRTFRDTHGVTLIVTGEGFTPGHDDPHQRYSTLRDYVRSHFDVQQELCWWMNEDYSSMDRLPFIGRTTTQARVYTGTGFSAWGLSNGTAAARILADLILGRRNPYAELFNPRRWNLRSGGKRLMQTNAQVARDFIADRLQHVKASSADELAKGEGALVRHHGRLSAAYRDEGGELHVYSPRCTHLGCLLRWNGAEKSWDCSCHGSRFDALGQVLHGPAVRDMRARDAD